MKFSSIIKTGNSKKVSTKLETGTDTGGGVKTLFKMK